MSLAHLDSAHAQAFVPSRRALLGAAAGLLLGGAGRALAGDPTPPMTEGPFHPFGGGLDRRIIKFTDADADLTFARDRPGNAQGQVIYLVGRVLDEAGRPVPGAKVEVWQACVSGRYDHRSDPSREWLDPAFQYSGSVTTGQDGRYQFRTILPGAYRADASWVRPPHIHVKVAAPGHRALTSQAFFRGASFYFAGRMYRPRDLDLLNAQDLVLASVPQRDQARVIATARRPLPVESTLFSRDALVCPWDVTVARGATGGTPELPD